jgi:hypothetical protein
MAYTMYLNGPQYDWFAQARGVVWEVQVSLRHEADGWHFDTLTCPLDGSGQRMAAQCQTEVTGVTDSVHQFSGQATMQSFEGFWLGLDESETPHATHPACGDISCFTGFRDAPWAQHSFSSFSGDVLSWGGFSIRRGRIADRVWPVPAWAPREVGR